MEEKELKKQFERIVTNMLPKIIKDSINNIRVGSVIAWNEASQSIDVRLSSGTILSSVKHQQGVTSVPLGSAVLLITADPFGNSNFKAIIF